MESTAQRLNFLTRSIKYTQISTRKMNECPLKKGSFKQDMVVFQA